MRKLSIFALSTLLAACQSVNLPPGTAAGFTAPLGSRAVNSRHIIRNFGADCHGIDDVFDHEGGGKIDLPELPDYSHYGTIRYASITETGLAPFAACPGSDNSFDVPVPMGNTPDWFGQIRFTFSTAFGQADLFGKMYAPGWLPKTDYSMYLYDGENNFIESYKIGRADVKKAVLKFPSPFENGFSTPADGTLNLEIVHPSK